MNRRTLIKYAGTGMVAGAISGQLGNVLASPVSEPKKSSAGKIPFSLIIDDGSPVDPLFYELPGYETPFLVPAKFTQKVADKFNKFDLRGKFTIIPMPSCLGRIDKSLKRVPQEHLLEFLRIMREDVAQRFDITPEYLTHLSSYDLKTGNYKRHLYEDNWITQAPKEEIVEYFSLAFQILRNVGIESTGITSPWVSGIDVEKKYAESLADAQWNLFKRNLTWYFLYAAADNEKPFQCGVTYKNDERGQKVVSVPANAGDIFWSMDTDVKDRQKMINDGIDRLISPDGKTGRIHDLINTGYPVVIVTHWQSLYTQGTELGLQGLTTLAERIKKAFGSDFEWVKCSEMARRYVDSIA